MKIIIINGSARKGNTLTAINALIKGASEKNEIEVIEPDKLQIAPCKGCGACQCHKGCVDNDDTNPTIDKIAAADMILFTTPVYWWGMSAQLKLVIDKCYCRGLQLKNKKVGVIAVGGSPVDSIQYELINKQFDCMADYLSWDMLFQKSYYASEKTDLAKDENSLKELEFDIVCQKFVDQGIIKGNTFFIYLSISVRKNTTPVDGEAIGMKANFFHQFHVFFETVVMITGCFSCS